MKIDYPLLLDGGLSNVLESFGCNLNHNLWSANLIDKNPESIIAAHVAYLEAGARCIITASYQASIQGLMNNGFDLPTSESLILKTVNLAETAIERFHKTSHYVDRSLIAGSIGPYGAYLADGSEYRGNYHVNDDLLYKFHERRIQLLDQSKIDFFACETIPSFREAKVLAELLKKTEKTAWLSFSCKDSKHINDGTLIEECVEFFAEHHKIFALGVNCTAPKHISNLIQLIKRKSGNKRIVIYPNSGEVFSAKTKTWQDISEPDLFIQMSSEWIKLGADIIGGCCRIGPKHIAGLWEIIQA